MASPCTPNQFHTKCLLQTGWYQQMHLEHKLTQRSTVAATVTSLNSQASTCASTKEAATRASSCIILRVSCYHHCTINLFGDQSERDNHPTIDSLTYGGNPMITSRHATHHHKNVSKHSLSKSRSDIGHRVIYLATLCNTITLPLQVQCTSYLTNSISNRRLITILKIQTHEHVLPPPVPAPKRLPAELGPQRGGMQQALGLQELSNNPTIIAETHFYKALHDPLAQRFQNMHEVPGLAST